MEGADVKSKSWNGVTDYDWKGSRIMWVKGKVGLVKYA